MIVSVKTEAQTEICAGTVGGRELLGRLLARTTREPSAPEAVVLDFAGVEVATASYLRESVLAFRDIVRGRRSNFYPVLANLNDVIREELEDLLQGRGDAILSGVADDQGRISDMAPLGRLDPKQQRLFDLILERRELDASQLQREFGDAEGVKQTAWNNRLSALAMSGLVVELSEGRSKRYKPMFEGV